MEYVIVAVLVLAVVLIVISPLRSRTDPSATADRAPGEKSSERLELEAERDAKYREIRDAELDHETGKLSDEDFAAIDSTLRSEAIVILRKLDRLRD